MSYRSYVPWKTNLPSYKSSATYSSRDDITGSDGKPIPKFGSITSPAAYRPSYSGGTYRSVPIKRDPPLSTYVSRYSSNTIDSSSQSKDDKNKVTDTITKKIQKPTTVSSATKYTPLSTTKEVNETPSTPSSSRLSTPSGNLSRYSRSRDPSPSVENRSRLLTPSKVKSREPSPARSALRARSRDPSPADITLRSKLTSPVNSYGSSYRLCPRSSSGYSSRYGSNNSLGRSPIANGALSYMSSSDVRARSINQQQEHIENESLKQNKDIKEEEFSKSETEETEEEEEEDNSNDSKATVPVTVVTRGTSPTPPGSSSVTRTRRIDIAKTIEKTIQRPVKKHKCIDKEIQSDRLDDSTRYSRFGATSRVSSIPWTPYTDSKLTSNLRYSSSSSKTSRDSTSISKSEQDSNERKKDDSGSAISRNSSFRSSTKKEKSKNKNTITSSTTSSTGSAEVCQIPGPKTLPPTIPKTESPTKTISSSSGNLKLPNKDFRKSSLNVGPTDRPRKSRTPSTSTDSEEKNEQTTQNVVQTNERSPSVGSETSATSSSSSSANNASKRCHQPKIRTSSSNISTQMKSFSENSSSIAVTNEASINSSGIGNSSSKFYNKNDRDIVNIRNKQLYQQQISPKYQQTSSKQHISTATNSNSQADDSSNASKNEGAKTYLLRKLGSVSNFFVTRSQDTSGELIYLDKSSSSNSTSNDLKQNGTIATTTASEQFIPVTTASQTNNSKTETSELDDSSWWLNTSQQIDTESALDIKDEMKFKIRHIDSGEIAWWMRNDDEDETIAEDIKTYAQDERSEFADNSQNTENLISPDQSWWTNENESKSEKYKIRRNDSGEQAWWLNDNEAPSISTNSREQLPRVSTDTNDKQKQQQIESSNQRSSSNENNSKNRSQNETTIDDSIWSRKSSPDKKQNSLDSCTKIYRVDSGEKPWWMNNEGDDETFVTNYDSPSKKENSQSPEKKNTSFAKIHRVDSSEKPWWLTEDNNNNENYSENTETHQNSDRTQNQYNLRHTPSDDKPWWMAGPTKKNFQIRHIDSGEKAWWLQDDSSEKADNKNCEKSEDSEVEKVITGNLSNSKTTENEDSLRPPLGDRASPEGLEDPSAKGRKSPYDNCLTSAKKSSSSSPLKNVGGSPNNDKQQNTQNLKKLFISRHTNIDELLGGSCRPLSPILDRFAGKNKFLEKITPAQVRIHDSTAQMPVIQRMERDNWASENISVPSTSSSVQQQKQKSSAFTYEVSGNIFLYLLKYIHTYVCILCKYVWAIVICKILLVRRRLE